MMCAADLLAGAATLPRLAVVSGVVNAAATTARCNLRTTTADMLDAQFATNVRGPLLVTRGCAEHLAAHPGALPRGTGSVVNISSVAAKGGAPFILGYSCAKTALETLTKNNAAELAPMGVRVNGISMGWCLTENEHAL